MLLAAKPAVAWSNGGYSTDPAKPDYGTHDWIAQHALDYLPTQEKQYLTDNLATYLHGTELPDNSGAQDGIGDTTKHHVYFSAAGALTDDASAQRASTEYNLALNYLKAKDYVDAAKTAGTMTHYIDDVGVFGHVMGASTPWGAETHHSDYEDHVNSHTSSYTADFNSYLSYDGSLTTISAYNATVNLAYDTTFGDSNHLTCTWMDANYNWNNAAFSGRCGQSLNLAVNTVLMSYIHSTSKRSPRQQHRQQAQPPTQQESLRLHPQQHRRLVAKVRNHPPNQPSPNKPLLCRLTQPPQRPQQLPPSCQNFRRLCCCLFWRQFRQ